MAREVILVTNALRCSATTAMILAILPKNALRKLPNQGLPTIIVNPAPTCIITIATGTGYTPSITDIANGTTLTVHDHAMDPSATEAPVTTRGMHPTLHSAKTAILGTHLQTGTLEDFPTGILHTTTGTTCPDTHHTRATHNTIQLFAVKSSSRHSLGTAYISHTRKVLKPCSCTETATHRPQCHKQVTIQDQDPQNQMTIQIL